tara:strand:+ start:106 stop:318 length:213 start_codon:yes stop_codon:yes gene_type:complete
MLRLKSYKGFRYKLTYGDSRDNFLLYKTHYITESEYDTLPNLLKKGCMRLDCQDVYQIDDLLANKNFKKL